MRALAKAGCARLAERQHAWVHHLLLVRPREVGVPQLRRVPDQPQGPLVGGRSIGLVRRDKHAEAALRENAREPRVIHLGDDVRHDILAVAPRIKAMTQARVAAGTDARRAMERSRKAGTQRVGSAKKLVPQSSKA